LAQLSTVDDNAVAFFYMMTAYTLTIDPYSTDTIILNGVELTAGQSIISAGNVGEYIILHKYSSTQWVVIGRAGLWQAV
jgi:hypothetical protein